MAWFRGEGYGLTYYPDADRPGERVFGGAEGNTLGEVDLTVPEQRKFYGELIGQGDLDGVSILFINDDRTVGFGADVLSDGTFTVEKLHPGAIRYKFVPRMKGIPTKKFPTGTVFKI